MNLKHLSLPRCSKTNKYLS